MYIDTSFLVAYYVPEDLSSKVYDLITDAETVCISSITKIEFLSALNKKVRMGFFTSGETQIALKEFENHVSEGLYKLIEVSSSHFKSSTEIIQQSKAPLRTLDAIHLGIVRKEQIEIASNDSTLLKTAKEFSIQTIEA